jgi:hypothetical protein
MAITTKAELELAIDSRFVTFTGSKPSISNVLPGNFMSTWPLAGLPGTGTTPTTTPVVLTQASTGGFNFPQPVLPMKAYMAEIQYTYTGAAQNTTLEIHDRMVHMGGLSGNITTLQTITGFDLSTLAATSNLDERKGDANYSDVQWWMELFVDVGGTNSNATVNVTFNDGSTGNLTVFNVGNNDRRINRMFPLNSLIAAADQGKYIRGINSLQLSASTGGAGNIGFVATRYRGAVLGDQPNERYRRGWTQIALPEIYANSCLSMIILGSSTVTGTTVASAKIIYG